MARRRTAPDAIRTKWQLADRLRTIRVEQFGEHGLAAFARMLDVPVRTWYSYEAGVTVPAEVLLKFVHLTSVEPGWLLHGREPKYQASAPRREREALDSAGWSPDGDSAHGTDETLPNGAGNGVERRNGHVAHSGGRGQGTWSLSAGGTAVIDLGEPDLDPESENGPWHFPVREEWQPEAPQCQFVRVEGEAMTPIVADGAFVGYSEAVENVAELDGKLVVAWPNGAPIVRWLHHSGEFAVLRAEQSASQASTYLINLLNGLPAPPLRRVLWIGTPH